MDGLLNVSGQQLPNNHFVDAQVKSFRDIVVGESINCERGCGIFATFTSEPSITASIAARAIFL
jgi:hypothetical protein